VRPVVVVPVCDRTHYVARTLESWRAVRGIGDAYTVHRCEPGFPEMAELAAAGRPECDGELVINETRLGNDQNMKAAVDAGFATGADFVIAAEDDVLVSADLLEYMTAMAGRYAQDTSVLAVTAFQDQAPGPLDEVRRAEWFWGGACWGMWRDRWETVRDDWPPSGGGYDGYLWRLARSRQMVTIQPLATRCMNIGEFGLNTHGEACGFADVWERQRFTPDLPPQSSWRERGGVWRPAWVTAP
jgi:GNT-I family